MAIIRSLKDQTKTNLIGIGKFLSDNLHLIKYDNKKGICEVFTLQTEKMTSSLGRH
jgi:hypothetical protein